MIHVATVHWQDDRWIDLQVEAFKKHTGEPYRIYAFLNDISTCHDSKFFYASHEPIQSHALKLNILAELIWLQSQPEDLLIFIDGDAWPIADFLAAVRNKLVEVPLVAVRRDENQGDIQPHPCFTATTVGFWHNLSGDWKAGHEWCVALSNGVTQKVTDVGGNLLEILQRNNIRWFALTRSNTINLHPLFFAVYGNIVYHHGAGFRAPLARRDLFKLGERHPFGQWLYLHTNIFTSLLFNALGYQRMIDRQATKNAELSKQVFKALANSPTFANRLIGAESDERIRMDLQLANSR